MPSIILTSTSPSFSYGTPVDGAGTPSASFSGGFLFYSNQPETVLSSGLADAPNNSWLNKQTVNGSGIIYTWHKNATLSTIHNAISVYNPNTFPITVSSLNYGTTNAYNVTDANAWLAYLNTSTTKSIVIQGLSYGTFFQLDNISNNNNFGVMARMNITGNGSSASAVVWDIAWISNSSTATKFAPTDGGSMKVGVGNGYYNYLTFPTISPTTQAGVKYYYGSNIDSFTGNDLVNITGGTVTGKLEGSYGQQLNVTIPVQNNTGATRSFRVFVGSAAGSLSIAVNGYGNVKVKREYITVSQYVDVVETSQIANGATENINFTIMMAAMSSANYRIGARAH
jgi:hypothetical protein